MLGKTHLRIADKIAEEFELGDKEKKLLELGSIDPDSWGKWPHHREKEQTIIENIFSARKKFLQEDDECFYDLGVSLHFLQDHWTLSPRTRDKHTKYEYELDKAKIVDFGQLIEIIQNEIMPEKAIKTYIKLAQTLSKISEKGIEQWYDGVWKYGLRDTKNTTSFIEPVVTEGLAAAIARLSLLHLPYVRDSPLEKEALDLFLYFEGKQYIFRKWGTPTIDLNLAHLICRNIFKYIIQSQNKEQMNKAWHSIYGLDNIIRDLGYPSWTFYSHEGWRKALANPWWGSNPRRKDRPLS